MSPDNVWYCKVLLLLTIQAQTDMDGSTAEFECAFVSVMETMEPRDGDNLSDLRKRGSRLIYEMNPKVLQKNQNICVNMLFCVIGEILRKTFENA